MATSNHACAVLLIALLQLLVGVLAIAAALRASLEFWRAVLHEAAATQNRPESVAVQSGTSVVDAGADAVLRRAGRARAAPGAPHNNKNLSREARRVRRRGKSRRSGSASGMMIRHLKVNERKAKTRSTSSTCSPTRVGVVCMSAIPRAILPQTLWLGIGG